MLAMFLTVVFVLASISCAMLIGRIIEEDFINAK